MNKKKGFIGFIAALTILFYAVPKLPIHAAHSEASLFAAVWLCFALLIVAAHLYYLFGVDRQEEEAYRRVQRLKRWRMQQQIARISRMRALQKERA